MGYRDAAAYLDAPHEDGVEPDASATRMEDPVPGVALRERLSGDGLELRLGWEVDDLDAFTADPKGTVVGDATHPALGARRLARTGEFRVDGGELTAELRFGPSRVELRRSLRDPEHAEARVDGGEPVRLARSGPPPWRTLHARGVGSAREGARARLRFSRWLRTSRALHLEP
jgi:hypothetical protein